MAKKDFTDFVDEIPECKLENLANKSKTLYPDLTENGANFQVDMQGVR